VNVLPESGRHAQAHPAECIINPKVQGGLHHPELDRKDQGAQVGPRARGGGAEHIQQDGARKAEGQRCGRVVGLARVLETSQTCTSPMLSGFGASEKGSKPDLLKNTDCQHFQGKSAFLRGLAWLPCNRKPFFFFFVW
jgi:hypothetical protein